MAEIIARGKVVQWVGNLYVEEMKGPEFLWRELGMWAEPYIGKAIVISLEEEEPVLNNNLKELLVEA